MAGLVDFLRPVTRGLLGPRRLRDLPGVSDRMLVEHTTPHTWAPEPGAPLGRPHVTSDTMGTGTGQQMFGPGLYTTQDPGVTQFYRAALAPSGETPQVSIGGRTVWPKLADFDRDETPNPHQIEQFAAYLVSGGRPVDEAAAIAAEEAARTGRRFPPSPYWAGAADILGRGDVHVTIPSAHTYQLGAPWSSRDFLDVEKTVGEQSLRVLGRLNKLGVTDRKYRALGLVTDPEAGVEWLRQAGIPGARMNTARHFGRPDGGRPDFTFFPGSEKRLDVMRRYGLLPGAATGVAGAGLLADPGEAEAAPVGRAARGLLGGPIPAWHVSPHQFDAFDASKIGTGIGEQGFGHGIYLSGNEPSFNWYYDELTKGPFATGDPIYRYDAAIHANPDKFLDWNRAVGEQPPGVRAALGYDESQVAGSDPILNFINDLAPDRITPTMSGGQAMSRLGGSPADVARRLQDQGLVGVRYDAGSGPDYSVFDPERIEILRRYGLMPGAAAGAVGAGLLGGGDAQAQEAQMPSPSQRETAKSDLRRQLFGMGAELPAGTPQATAYSPTVRDRLGGLLSDMGMPDETVSGLVGSRGAGMSGPMAGMGLLDFLVPFDAEDAIRAGDYQGAAMSVLPGESLAGRAAMRGARGPAARGVRSTVRGLLGR